MKIFFPLFHVNIFKSTHFLIVLAMLLAVQLVMRKLIIPMPAFRTQISFIWLPVMVVGWFYGPIYGFIFGWVTDTIGFLLGGGAWFWMYAIQEPVVAFFAGIIGGLARLTFNIKKIYFHLIFQQILLFLFMGFSFGYLFYWFFSQEELFKINWVSQILFYVVIAFLTTYVIFLETIIFWLIWKKSSKIILYLYATIIVSSMIFLWSFLLGPEIAIQYYGFINNGRIPENIKKYGPIFYLIPRIIRETIKTPVQTLIFTLLIFSINPVFQKMYNRYLNSYDSENLPKWKKKMMNYLKI